MPILPVNCKQTLRPFKAPAVVLDAFGSRGWLSQSLPDCRFFLLGGKKTHIHSKWEPQPMGNTGFSLLHAPLVSFFVNICRPPGAGTYWRVTGVTPPAPTAPVTSVWGRFIPTTVVHIKKSSHDCHFRRCVAALPLLGGAAETIRDSL